MKMLPPITTTLLGVMGVAFIIGSDPDQRLGFEWEAAGVILTLLIQLVAMLLPNRRKRAWVAHLVASLTCVALTWALCIVAVQLHATPSMLMMMPDDKGLLLLVIPGVSALAWGIAFGLTRIVVPAGPREVAAPPPGNAA